MSILASKIIHLTGLISRFSKLTVELSTFYCTKTYNSKSFFLNSNKSKMIILINYKFTSHKIIVTRK